MNKWNFMPEEPESLKPVLFITEEGQIFKGFLNLMRTWIIQNNEGLIARYLARGNVKAWMELPVADDKGWKSQADEQPKEGSYILSKDWLDGSVHIVYVALPDRWIIRNTPQDEITFWQTSEKNMWMPLPEFQMT